MAGAAGQGAAAQTYDWPVVISRQAYLLLNRQPCIHAWHVLLQAGAAAVANSGASASYLPPCCSDPSRPIRQQRALYEAVVGLEKEGASVVERSLALLDAVLSPSAALIICDNSTQCQV